MLFNVHIISIVTICAIECKLCPSLLHNLPPPLHALVITVLEHIHGGGPPHQLTEVILRVHHSLQEEMPPDLEPQQLLGELSSSVLSSPDPSSSALLQCLEPDAPVYPVKPLHDPPSLSLLSSLPPVASPRTS